VESSLLLRRDVGGMASGAPTPDDPGGRMAYQPALDGVRAVSIAVVLAFHLEAGWMPGGYLGVSVFFTLSGFLITSLLLAEHARAGRIDLRGFYLRRARRLLPAALACLAGVGTLGAAGAFGPRDLGPELLGALAQVANWEALLRERPYAELFMAPSPVAHFWSLAIEEQFYWLWPLAMTGVTALAVRGRRRGHRGHLVVPDPARRATTRVAVALGALFALSAASAPLTARWLGSEAVYLASWTRFAEILAGAVLAAVLAGRGVPTAVRHLALPALATIVALCVLTPSTGGWAYGGGLPLFALLTVALVVGLQAPGPVATALSWRPLTWVGQISYGLYLYHWPVIVLLDGTRTGLDGPALAALRLGVTFGVATVSYVAVERPIRAGHRLPRGTPRFVLAAAAASLAVLALAMRPPTEQRVSTTDQAALPLAPAAAPGVGAGSEEEQPRGDGPAAAPRPVSIALLGDSVLDWLLRDAAGEFHAEGVVLIDGAHEACDGAVDRPPVRDRRGRVLPTAPGCQEWPVSYAEVVEAGPPVDIALVSVGGGAFLDHELPTGWAGPCEDMQWYVDDVRARLGYLDGRVGEAVVLVPSWLGERATFALPDDHPERATCARGQMFSLAEELGLRTIDFAEILCPEGPQGDCSIFRRLDGVHVEPGHAAEILDWLVDEALLGRRASTTGGSQGTGGADGTHGTDGTDGTDGAATTPRRGS
jgi:peptidoglycan/LPS O-acetylase OafA/YrhL